MNLESSTYEITTTIILDNQNIHATRAQIYTGFHQFIMTLQQYKYIKKSKIVTKSTWEKSITMPLRI